MASEAMIPEAQGSTIVCWPAKGIWDHKSDLLDCTWTTSGQRMREFLVFEDPSYNGRDETKRYCLAPSIPQPFDVLGVMRNLLSTVLASVEGQPGIPLPSKADSRAGHFLVNWMMLAQCHLLLCVSQQSATRSSSVSATTNLPKPVPGRNSRTPLHLVSNG
jgi:hypothetical protein